jgi:hemerythrin
VSDAAPKDEPQAAAMIAEQTASAHRELRTHFERIEQALSVGDLQLGAQLLNDLIDQARHHFLREERIAQEAGIAPGACGRWMHDALMERARRLKARCLNSPVNTDLRHTIEAELVVLLSDLVESDLRIAQRVDAAANPPR